MIVVLVVFLLGTKRYRYCLKEEKNPFLSILVVFVASACNQNGPSPTTDRNNSFASLVTPSLSFEENNSIACNLVQTSWFLDRAAAAENPDSLKQGWSVCTTSPVEDAKMVLWLFPIWATCLIYGVIVAKSSTFFTKQGSTMERGIGSEFQVPPATLQRIGIGMFISVVSMVVAAVVVSQRLAVVRDAGLIDEP
ncbi:protein NRT1/ PTR FAMILY 5.10-like protein isoform X1 [Cinnamomum micranthum f. kanehirae]|uniref:Protein NRT1/ PTR FAMILY 5.10-like protein isoform X1 n=1 Tax=Cinnamomum micranthum f. kanehirae TaxID=337451 RepID=A0A443NRG2_9MAGN|nr:protein NRT1/ PTR FAMILY 5.10-like protein isoform X1 [Cinnamomum micranthum f. kanehirae]